MKIGLTLVSLPLLIVSANPSFGAVFDLPSAAGSAELNTSNGSFIFSTTAMTLQFAFAPSQMASLAGAGSTVDLTSISFRLDGAQTIDAPSSAMSSRPECRWRFIQDKGPGLACAMTQAVTRAMTASCRLRDGRTRPSHRFVPQMILLDHRPPCHTAIGPTIDV